MTRQFTSEDADRLLQIGDQFLEDWEQSALESADDADYAEFQERHDEWTAVRPLLAAAPALLALANRHHHLLSELHAGNAFSKDWLWQALSEIEIAIAKAGAA